MSNTSRENMSYPLCREFFCEIYWEQTTIIGWVNIFVRMAIAVLIFLLGTKMEKDFIRSVTVAIFIPIFLSEFFNIYCEVVAFMSLFCSSNDEFKVFYATYVSWTSQLVFFVFDYNHYNCLVMVIFLIHCCRLATYPGDHINLFPINTICWVLQIIPFFVSVMLLIEGQDALRPHILFISCISRVITCVGVIVLIFRIIFAIRIVMRPLPYAHAAAPDIQLQDARSRLAWCLIYAIVPLITLLPFFAESITWISVMVVPKGQTNTTVIIQSSTEILKYLINYYRRAVPLLFLSCSFCPQVKVEAVPRRPKETSNMYRYAD